MSPPRLCDGRRRARRDTATTATTATTSTARTESEASVVDAVAVGVSAPTSAAAAALPPASVKTCGGTAAASTAARRVGTLVKVTLTVNHVEMKTPSKTRTRMERTGTCAVTTLVSRRELCSSVE